MRPTVLYKVYDESDTFLGLLNDPVNELEIPSQINSLGSAIQITLARNADSTTPALADYETGDGNPLTDNNGFVLQALLTPQNKIGPGSMINHNYKVVVDAVMGADSELETSSGTPFLTGSGEVFIASIGGDAYTKFQGFISDIDIDYGNSENTVITVASFGYDADQYVVGDSSIGETSQTFNSYDPSDIVKEGLDALFAQAGTITYDGSSVDDTGTTVSYTFNTNTYAELIQKALELAPSDWYYYLDMGTNLVYFKARPVTPDHYFFLGKHIESLQVKSTILESVSDGLFSGGDDPSNPGENIYVRERQTPAAGTRRSLKRVSDNRVTTLTGAGIIIEGEVDRNNLIIYRSTITILSSTYDINTIKLGDLIGLRNFDNYVDLLEFQVTRMTFSLDKVVLEVGTLLPRVSKRIEDIKRNLLLQETVNNPDVPS